MYKKALNEEGERQRQTYTETERESWKWLGLVKSQRPFPIIHLLQQGHCLWDQPTRNQAFWYVSLWRPIQMQPSTARPNFPECNQFWHCEFCFLWNASLIQQTNVTTLWGVESPIHRLWCWHSRALRQKEVILSRWSLSEAERFSFGLLRAEDIPFHCKAPWHLPGVWVFEAAILWHPQPEVLNKVLGFSLFWKPVPVMRKWQVGWGVSPLPA